ATSSSSSWSSCGLHRLDHVSSFLHHFLNLAQQGAWEGNIVAREQDELRRRRAVGACKCLLQLHPQAQIGDPRHQQILVDDELAPLRVHLLENSPKLATARPEIAQYGVVTQ